MALVNTKFFTLGWVTIISGLFIHKIHKCITEGENAPTPTRTEFAEYACALFNSLQWYLTSVVSNYYNITTIFSVAFTGPISFSQCTENH